MPKLPSSNFPLETRDLSAVPAAALAAELRRRERHLQSLVRRYEQIMEAASKLREEIEALGGSMKEYGAADPASSLRTRPRNPANLVNTLRIVLSGKTLSVAEAAEAAVQAGYRSTSASFRKIVNHTLQVSPHFERMGRGRYTAK